MLHYGVPPILGPLITVVIMTGTIVVSIVDLLIHQMVEIVFVDGKWHHCERLEVVIFSDNSLMVVYIYNVQLYMMQTVGFRPAMIGGVSDVAAHTSNNGLDIIDGRFQVIINQFRVVVVKHFIHPTYSW